MGPIVRAAPGLLRLDHRQHHRERRLLIPEGRRGDDRERASAAVEFALVLPLVLVMALALLQVGLLVKDQMILAGSARAGAREGAVTDDDERVRQAVQDAAAGLAPDALAVEIARAGQAGTPVTVTVRYRANALLPLVAWLFPEPIDLSSTATFRQEV